MNQTALLVVISALIAVLAGSPPEFKNRIEDVTVIEGDEIQAFCYATGERPMNYAWDNQNSDRIPEDSRRDIYASNSDNGSYLIVKAAKFHHEGMYSCSANNSHGLSSKLFKIHVSPRTGEDTDNDTFDITVLNVSASSVQLKIEFRNASAKASATSKYIRIQYRESYTGKGDWNLLTIDEKKTIYNINKLIPGGLYSFQCRINSNEYKWSSTFRVTLLPDVPEIIFRNRRVEKGSIELEWFVKADDRMRGTIDEYEIAYYAVRTEYGNDWISSNCRTTTRIPSCHGSQYTIYGLQERVYYQIEVRAHTAGGYGEKYRQKIYLPG